MPCDRTHTEGFFFNSRKESGKCRRGERGDWPLGQQKRERRKKRWDVVRALIKEYVVIVHRGPLSASSWGCILSEPQGQARTDAWILTKEVFWLLLLEVLWLSNTVAHCPGWWFENLIEAGEEENSTEKIIPCLQAISNKWSWLMIRVVRASSFWMMPLQDSWSRIVQESRLSKPWVAS